MSWKKGTNQQHVIKNYLLSKKKSISFAKLKRPVFDTWCPDTFCGPKVDPNCTKFCKVQELFFQDTYILCYCTSNKANTSSHEKPTCL